MQEAGGGQLGGEEDQERCPEPEESVLENFKGEEARANGIKEEFEGQGPIGIESERDMDEFFKHGAVCEEELGGVQFEVSKDGEIEIEEESSSKETNEVNGPEAQDTSDPEFSEGVIFFETNGDDETANDEEDRHAEFAEVEEVRGPGIKGQGGSFDTMLEQDSRGGDTAEYIDEFNTAGIVGSGKMYIDVFHKRRSVPKNQW